MLVTIPDVLGAEQVAPATSMHSVAPVTRGSRWAAVFHRRGAKLQ